MSQEVNYIDRDQQNKGLAQQFALWLGLGSIVMMFAAFMSAYIVRQSAGDWLDFRLPMQFFFSTLVIIASSVTIQKSFTNYKAGHKTRYQYFLLSTFVLGVVFLILQVLGWQEMFHNGIDLKGNPSGSFVYVISGAHALHIVAGLAILLIGLYTAFYTPFKVTPKRTLHLKLTTTFWHFVDILWVVLLIFFIVQR